MLEIKGLINGNQTLSQVFDILDESNSSVLGTGRKFDLCLDKGTYDAVSLNPKDAEGCRAKYIHRVSSLLAPDGLFIICSCNWTKSELMSQFQSGEFFVCLCVWLTQSV